jgi:hypothetical protein
VSRITLTAQASWRLGQAVGLSLLLTTVQLLPTAEFVSQSSRNSGAERTFALTYSFWPWRLVTLLAPNFFGNPAQGNYWGYANYWEDHAYLGVLPVILALVAIWHYLKRRLGGHKQKIKVGQKLAHTEIAQTPQPLQVVPFFATLVPISLILALGWNTPVYLWIFDFMPGFGFFQAPARLLIWYTVAMAVLAGVGAQFFVSTPETRPNWRRLLIACVGITVAGVIGESFLAGRNLTFLTATRTAGILLTISIILLLIRPEKDNPGFVRESLWQWVIIIFVGVDLFLAALPLIPTLSSTIFSRPVASAELIKTQPGEHRFFVDNRFVYTTTFDRYFRFKTFGPLEVDNWQGFKETLVPNFGVYTGLPSANNDDPLTVGHWQQLTQRLRKANDVQRARLLSLMNVGYLISSPNETSWEIIYTNEALAIQRVPYVLPRAYFVPRASYVRDSSEAMTRLIAPDFDSHQEVIIMDGEVRTAVSVDSLARSDVWPVTINEQGSSQVQLTVEAPNPGFVVLTDTFYPGWQVTVDGQAARIWQANLAFRAVAVEAGQHEISFRYRPRSFMVGLWISSVTGLIIVVMVVRLVRLHRAANDSIKTDIRS